MQELPVQAADGHRFSLRLFPVAGARAVFILCPAMGVAASYYDKFAAALNAHGVQVAITDLRGQGSSSWRASRAQDWGYARMVEQDFPVLTQAVQAEWPGLPLYFFGHSQGGHLALLYLAHRPAGVSGLLTIACGSTYYKGWPFPQSLKILMQTQAVRLPAALLGYFPGARMGFGGLQARTEMTDWANTAVNGRYDLIDAGLDYEQALAQVGTPACMFSLRGDEFAPAGAAAFLAGKLPGARHVHLQDLPAGAGDHFRWSRQPEAIIPHLLQALV